LEGLERRLKSLPTRAGASPRGLSVTVTNPPSATGAAATPAKPDVLTFSAIAKANATQAKALPRTAAERKFDALLNAVEGLERHLAALEITRQFRSD
jgi:hypothetical protein